MTSEVSVIAGSRLAAVVQGDADAAWLAALQPPPSQADSAAAGSVVLAAHVDGRPRALVRFTPAIGLSVPRHWYHVGCVVHASPELGRRLPLATLQLNNDLTGDAELAGWCTDPTLDADGAATAWRALLAAGLGRVAAAPGRPSGAAGSSVPGSGVPGPEAATRLLVELPGPRDAAGRSPFWEGLGRPFYNGDPAAAQARFGDAWRSHVAALLPRQLVYSAFLPEAAQAAIGAVHADAVALATVLHQAGLRWSRQIRIDDGGPVFIAEPGAGKAPA